MKEKLPCIRYCRALRRRRIRHPLIDADAERASRLPQRIANRLSEQPDEPRLSVSIGSAVYPEDGQSPQDLLEAADRRLYRNKKALRWQTADADLKPCRASLQGSPGPRVIFYKRLHKCVK